MCVTTVLKKPFIHRIPSETYQYRKLFFVTSNTALVLRPHV